MSIKTAFSIKDLENLSGIKSHTIRIWEKRYKLLQPNRSDTNIRVYSLENLQKLLNVVILLDHEFKISNIARMDESELFEQARDLVVDDNDSSLSLNRMKLSMLTFDQPLFEETYHHLTAQFSFRDIFLNIFMKLLRDIGFLWSTKTILPAHERFISSLIIQKISTNIDLFKNQISKRQKAIVLFLPMNENHEIGLLYLHYELLCKGFRSIYLGSSIPLDNLLDLQSVFEEITYISWFTVQPSPDRIEEYLSKMSEKILSTRQECFHILGSAANALDLDKLPPNVFVHSDIMNLIDEL